MRSKRRDVRAVGLSIDRMVGTSRHVLLFIYSFIHTRYRGAHASSTEAYQPRYMVAARKDPWSLVTDLPVRR